VVKHYQTLRSNYTKALGMVNQLVERTPEELAQLTEKSNQALELLDAVKRKKLEGHEKLVIGTVVFLGVGLVVTAGVNAWQHREQPDVKIDPVSVQLAEQKVAQESPEQPSFKKQ
jgi:hypothetical protein